MNYVTTNIRLPEEDYLQLKEEAFRKRESLAALIRKKISSGRRVKASEKLILRIKRHAKENAKYLKGVSGVKIIREIRDQAKW